MGEVLAQLDGPSHAAHPAPAPRRLAVAVLPFVNTSGDPDDEYFSDGVTDELIHTLTGLPGLRVAARSSCFAQGTRRGPR